MEERAKLPRTQRLGYRPGQGQGNGELSFSSLNPSSIICSQVGNFPLKYLFTEILSES